MPTEISGEVYYTTSEVCKETGISRPTLFRWLKQGVLKEIRKDRRGWRLFTEDDLNTIKAETRRIEVKEMLQAGAQQIELWP
jgi:excisionase family DNA binding protein